METISVYTRQEALNDGVLSDIWVNKCAKELGIKWHCACTASLHAELSKASPQSDAFFYDMLFLFRQFILVPAKKMNKDISIGDSWQFKMSLGKKNKTVKVVFSVEQLDGQDEVVPCWTFMNTNED